MASHKGCHMIEARYKQVTFVLLSVCVCFKSNIILNPIKPYPHCTNSNYFSVINSNPMPHIRKGGKKVRLLTPEFRVCFLILICQYLFELFLKQRDET